mmetsp:Transcript_10965/g.16725  ORF Transcript_10965/g.16725 Transcript_10965/m.16725 type:complete len:80 (-) Transcript_10965:236-475(-)
MYIQSSPCTGVDWNTQQGSPFTTLSQNHVVHFFQFSDIDDDIQHSYSHLHQPIQATTCVSMSSCTSCCSSKFLNFLSLS